MAKTKKEVEALDQDDRGDSSLAGWAEVIRQEGERSRKAERERKAKLDELLADLEDGASSPYPLDERVLRLFDIYRTGFMQSGEFCAKVLKWCADERGVSDDEY